MRRQLPVLLAGVAIAALLLVARLLPPRLAPPSLLLTGPGARGEMARTLGRLFDGARSRIRVALYVMRQEDDGTGPVTHLIDALGRAAARGVDVAVLLDQGPDHTGAPDDKHVLPAAALQARGVRVVLDEEAVTSHAKVAVIDSRWCLVGSHNWTRSACLVNREASVLVEDPAMARTLEALLFGDLAP